MGKITDLLKNRFSVRKFQPGPIPQHVLDEILEAGRLSPSGGNEQPWRFGVITDSDLIAQIAQLAHRQEWMAHAPLLIVLCTVFVDDVLGGRDIQIHRFPEHASAIAKMEQDLYWSLYQEEHQTKIAGTHMDLVALEYGVGSCWVSRFEVQPRPRCSTFQKIPCHLKCWSLVIPNARKNLSPKRVWMNSSFLTHKNHHEMISVVIEFCAIDLCE